MAETLCQKRALEAFQLDPAKWGGKNTGRIVYACQKEKKLHMLLVASLTYLWLSGAFPLLLPFTCLEI